MTHSGGSSPGKTSAAPPRKRFTLSGRSAAIDPRVDAVRGDLADVQLADRVFAPHYARALRCQITTLTDLRALPKTDSDILAALGAGDVFELFDVSGGWAWGRAAGRVGYVPAAMVATP